MLKRYHLKQSDINELAGTNYEYKSKHYTKSSSTKTKIKRGGVQKTPHTYYWNGKKVSESEFKRLQSGKPEPKEETYLGITGVKTKQGKTPIEKQVTHVYRKSESGKYEKIGTMKPQPKPDSYLVVYPAVKPSERAGKTFPAGFLGITKSGESVGKVQKGTISYGVPEYKTVKSPFKSQEELEKYTIKKKTRIRDIPSLLYELDKRRIEMQLGVLGRGSAKVTQKLGLHEPPIMTRPAFEKRYPDKSYALYLQRKKGEALVRTGLAVPFELPYTTGSQIYGASQFIGKTIKNPKTYPKKAIKGGIKDIQSEYKHHPQRFAGKQIGTFLTFGALGWGLQKILHYSPPTTSASVTDIKELGKGKYVGKGKIVTKAGKQKVSTDVRSLMKVEKKGKVSKSESIHALRTGTKEQVGFTKGLTKKMKFKDFFKHKIKGHRVPVGKKYGITDVGGKYLSKTIVKTTTGEPRVSVHVGKTISVTKGKPTYALSAGYTEYFPKPFDTSKLLFKVASKPTTTSAQLIKAIYGSHLKTVGAGLKVAPKYTPTPSVTAGIIGLGLVGATTPKVLKTPEKQAHFSLVGTIKPKTQSRLIRIPRINYQGLL
ncbi:MAG: hypothetical protein ACTSVB_07855, partial [Candidatus Heimdallarchaeaceae archaeon]